MQTAKSLIPLLEISQNVVKTHSGVGSVQSCQTELVKTSRSDLGDTLVLLAPQ